LPGQFHDIGRQPIFVFTALGNPALGRTMLPQDPAYPTLGYGQNRPDMVDTGAAARGA
jgi:hypothetical protein